MTEGNESLGSHCSSVKYQGREGSIPQKEVTEAKFGTLACRDFINSYQESFSFIIEFLLISPAMHQ